MNGTNGTCFICSWLSMTRRDVVIIDILILLSSASTPLISFVSSLSLSRSLFHVPPAARFYFFLLSIRHPFFLSSESLLYSRLPVDRTCSFVHRLTPASFIVVHGLPLLFSSCLLCLPRHHFFSFSPRLLLPICSSSPVFSSFYVILRISASSRSLFFYLAPSLFSIFLSLLYPLFPHIFYIPLFSSLSLDSHLLLLYTRTGTLVKYGTLS